MPSVWAHLHSLLYAIKKGLWCTFALVVHTLLQAIEASTTASAAAVVAAHFIHILRLVAACLGGDTRGSAIGAFGYTDALVVLTALIACASTAASAAAVTAALFTAAIGYTDTLVVLTCLIAGTITAITTTAVGSAALAAAVGLVDVSVAVVVQSVTDLVSNSEERITALSLSTPAVLNGVDANALAAGGLAQRFIRLSVAVVVQSVA